MPNSDLARHLEQFQAAELIRLVQAAPEPEYLFRHTLVQEAVYESLLKATRAALHGRVAAAMEEWAGDRREAMAAVLALHYERAGLDAKAFPYAVQAGDAARRTYAHQEALAHYDLALEIAARSPKPYLTASLGAVYIGRGRVLEMIGDHAAALANYRDMLAAAQRAGDLAMEADAMNRAVTVQAVLSPAAAELCAQLDTALDLARQSGEQALIGRALWNNGLYYRFQDPLRAIEYLEAALDLTKGADPANRNMAELAGSVSLDLTISAYVCGRYREAREHAQTAVVAFRALGNQQMLADALGGQAIVLYLRGDAREARASADEGERISQMLDNPWGVVYNRWIPVQLDLDQGRFEQALADTEQRLADARAVGFSVFVGRIWTQVARARLELGQFQLAQTAADEGALAFAEINQPTWSTWARGIVGQALVRCGELNRAHQLLDPLWAPGDDPVTDFQGFWQAGPAIAELALAENRLDFGLAFCDWFLGRLEPEEAWRLAGEMRFLRGLVLLAAGDHTAAEADLLESHGRLTQAEAPTLLWRVDARLADLYAAAGDPDRAMPYRQKAAELVQRLAEGTRDEKLRRSFLERADVREALGDPS